MIYMLGDPHIFVYQTMWMGVGKCNAVVLHSVPVPWTPFTDFFWFERLLLVYQIFQT